MVKVKVYKTLKLLPIQDVRHMRYRAYIRDCTLDVTEREIALAVDRVRGRSLERLIRSRILFIGRMYLDFHSTTLKEMVRRFGETMIAAPEAELMRLFDVIEGLAPRGVPTGFRRLYIPFSSLKYSIAAVEGAIGEALAGLVMMKVYGFRALARPIGLSPDIVMERDSVLALVESKATILSDITKGILEGAIRIIDHFSHFRPLVRERMLEGYVIGTTLHDRNFFIVDVLRLRPRITRL